METMTVNCVRSISPIRMISDFCGWQILWNRLSEKRCTWRRDADSRRMGKPVRRFCVRIIKNLHVKKNVKNLRKKELHISAQYVKIPVIDRSFLHPPGRIIFSKIILYLHNFSENCVLPERLVPQFRSGKMTTENGRRAAGRDTAERCFDSGFQGGSDRGLMSCRVS